MIRRWQTMMITFYDNLISSGTKISTISLISQMRFYDNLISSGTKITSTTIEFPNWFYDNLISSGTKIYVNQKKQSY